MAMKSYLKRGHAVIERVSLELDGGRHRPKAVVGEAVPVSADIFRDGPDMLLALVRYKAPSESRWREAPMTFVDNDRWTGDFVPAEIGRYKVTITAFTNHFGTWRRDLSRRVEARQQVDLELEEGAILLERHVKAVRGDERRMLKEAITALRAVPDEPKDGFEDPRIAVALDSRIASIVARHHVRENATTYKPVIEVTVDRERGRVGAWYEFFPRSTGENDRHGTFETAAQLLPVIADMGFDVVYLPPIHPIGTTARKGRNNALVAGPGDVGVPWAIGGPEGGHTAVHPQLGTSVEFDDFVARAQGLGLEIALDFAIQCSPDHPWVKQHPEWFHHRPDGTIKYAENPPKKYQDIYPINFDTDDREGLWRELKAVIDFWVSHGVKIFRVDNPHTKPFAFWEWLIESVQKKHPDVIFLAEAFTRPKVMYALAKLGFTQSYTYFTWRNTKWELMEYLNELAHSDMALYFRPNFFTNTQDILHDYLQTGGPPAFKVRLCLAALLSPTYGIYSGFEFFENVAREPGSEEYLHSEKYELRPRAWGSTDSLAPYITRINQIRRKNPSLSTLSNLRWHGTDRDQVLAFSKASPGAEPILVVVNLNPFHWEECTVSLDLGALGLDDARPFEVHDLLTDTSYSWSGPHNYVRLDPSVEPAHVFAVRR